MKTCNAPENQTTRRILPTVSAIALAVAVAAALSQPAHARDVTPPPVPANIQVPAGIAFREGHAVGTQNYICLASVAGFDWILFGPQATLFNDRDGQVITHFLSPNPFESDTNTIGGIAPSTGCTQATDVGKKAFVPYAADYFFVK